MIEKGIFRENLRDRTNSIYPKVAISKKDYEIFILLSTDEDAQLLPQTDYSVVEPIRAGWGVIYDEVETRNSESTLIISISKVREGSPTTPFPYPDIPPTTKPPVIVKPPSSKEGFIPNSYNGQEWYTYTGTVSDGTNTFADGLTGIDFIDISDLGSLRAGSLENIQNYTFILDDGSIKYATTTDGKHMILTTLMQTTYVGG